MPTTLARFQVTRTAEVERALEIAAREWPGAPVSELATRLMVEAAERREAERAERRERRRAALRATQGTIAYPPGYLEDLRKDGPE